MSSTLLFRELLGDRTGLVPLSVEQYHRMIEEGILPEDPAVELLDGQLFRKDRSQWGADPMTVGHYHAWVIDKFADLLSDLKAKGHYLRVQSPVSISTNSEPEPDVAIVRGSPDDYREHHPGPDDVVCVIEVADSSLNRDRTTKLRVYADAGIKRYLIINLIDKSIEDYREPAREAGRYGVGETLRKGQRLSTALGSQAPIDLAVDQLLP